MKQNYTAIHKIRYGTEFSVLMASRRPNTARRAVIHAHGANGDAGQVLGQNSLPTLANLFSKVALAGNVVISGDFGGKQTWGNDAGLTAMEQAINWILASGLCKSDQVIISGTSMGSSSCHRYAKEHPTLVAAMLLMMPVLDAEDIRNRNAVGSTQYINTAWGLTTGSTLATGGAPIPTNGRPMDLAPAVDTIPTLIEYGTADQTCTAAACDTYAGLRTPANLSRHITNNTGDHGDTALVGLDISNCLAFIDAHAA